MSLSIDHLVILVKDLERAVQDYTKLGFTVTPGGEHSDGATHNALIAFQDGVYLELIAFKREAPEHRWWPFTRRGGGEGLIDFALLPTDITATIQSVRQRGLDYSGPFPGGRLRPDGQEIRWQTAQPPSPDLPFLCADITPRELRVPQGTAQQHSNGVSGLKCLTVRPDEPAKTVERYRALLGQEPEGAYTGATGFALGSSLILVPDQPSRSFTDFKGGDYLIALRGPQKVDVATVLPYKLTFEE